MSSSMDKLAKSLHKSLAEADSKKPKPYDTEAEVSRVEGDVLWVKFPGGENETPVRRTMDAKPGDNVMVRVSGGRAWAMGNSTSPPTDDSRANSAYEYASTVGADLIVTNKVIADTIEANNARFNYVEADTAKIHNLEADEIHAGITYTNELIADDVTTEKLTAASGYIEDLTSNNITANNIVADHATIDTLDSTYATIDELHSDYAEIDLANVNNAWIQSGVIKNGAISDAQIIGVSANKLTAGTIDASNITVTNLNADNITTGTINGQRIGSESITLDKLAEEVPTKAYLDNVAQNLQGQIDGQIETWTGTVVPTLNNSPASSWSTADERHKHVGDIYYVVNAGNTADGYTYRFTESGTTTKTYSWTLIKDNQITKALQDILDIQGDISDIETFDSQISSWKTDTDSELSSLKSRTSTLETGMGNKVDTTTFNELSQTVDENSASITSLTTTVNSKADSSTVTTLSNTVNSVQQTATGNSSKISQLTTTLGTNADGTTKAGDIVHRTSAVEQDLSGFHTTVEETYATKASVNSKADASTVYTKSEIDQTVSGINASVSAKADGASTTAALALKANKDTLTSEINASADTVKINADRVNIEGAAIFNNTGRLSSTSLNNAYDSKGSASTAESNAKGYADGLADDLQDEIDAKKSVHTLSTNYSYTYANILTYSGEGNTSHGAWAVTSASGVKVGDTVRLKVTVSDMSNAPVYVIGTVTAVSGNNVTMTSHGLDTTVIDGGHILTNSITASQIAASAITADELDTNSINNSGLLTTGALTVGARGDVLNNNIIVGGRNLLFDPYTTKSSVTQNGLTLSYDPTTSDFTITGTNTKRDAAWSFGTIYPTSAECRELLGANLKKDTDYTLSLYGMPSGMYLQINGYTSSGGAIGLISVAGTGTTIHKTFQLPSNTDLSRGVQTVFFGVYSTASAISGTFKVKLEEGNKGTAWSRAPESTLSSADLNSITNENLAYGTTLSSVAGANTGTTGFIILYNVNKMLANFGAGADITLSFYARADSAVSDVAIYPYQTSGRSISAGNVYINLTTSWQRFIIHTKVTDHAGTYNDGAIMFFYKANDTTKKYIRMLQIERGFNVTPWNAPPASHNITTIDENGIRIHPASTENNSVVINASGMEVFKGGTGSANSVAFYGDSARIGKASAPHVSINASTNDSSIDIYGADGTALLAHFGYANGTTQSGTGTALAPYYDIGVREGNKGGYSTVEGYANTASGWASHAEGNQTTASGSMSHAEGYFSVASKDYAHAEGNQTTASGNYSHASGSYTKAQGDNQTVIGKSNIADTTSAFIIGNGTTSARSNALTVDWDGNVNIASDAHYKINGTNLSASNVGAVPTSRTVNGKALSANITLSASDVSAVPTTRTVNGKALSSNITLSASDVSALPSSGGNLTGVLKSGGYALFTQDSFNKALTIAANSVAEGTIDIAKTGYKPIAVSGVWCTGTGSSFAMIYRSYISGNNYTYGIRNMSGATTGTASQITPTLYVNILYVSSTQGI